MYTLISKEQNAQAHRRTGTRAHWLAEAAPKRFGSRQPVSAPVSALGLDYESVVAETILDRSRLMHDRTVKADQILRIELIGQNGAAMTFVDWNDCCAQLDIYINCVEASARGRCC